MSQMRHSMKKIEEGANLKGRLLRPLSARLLDPTIPELEGKIDRSKLLEISGRSRKNQMQLAENFGITDYLPPAGGCLLTDKNFASRMKDTLKFGYRNFRETIALQWGRHYRINDQFKVVLGRNGEENNSLKTYAHPNDLILEFPDQKGPTLILKGNQPEEKIVSLAASMMKHFSKKKNESSVYVNYWPANDPSNVKSILAQDIGEEAFSSMKV